MKASDMGFSTYDIDIKLLSWGTWVAQSVKHLTIGFGGSGRDLCVLRWSPGSGSVIITESA